MSEFPRPVPNLVHKDGTQWESSYRDQASAMLSLFDKKIPPYFFREVIPNPKRNWWTFWRPKWVRTGRVWEGHDYRSAGFQTLEESFNELWEGL